jgi:AraC-like DNA-binding protein
MTQIARSAVFIGFDSLCRDNGLNPYDVLKRCALDPVVLRRRDLYVPYARFAQALSLAATESGNHLFGLQLSRYHDYLVLGPFGLLLAQAESFPEVLKLTQKYVHLHAQGIELSVVERAETLEVRYAVALRERVDQRQLLELGMGVVHRSLASLFGDVWRPRRVDLSHEAQTEVSHYQAFFGCEVVFAQPHNAFSAEPAIIHQRPVEQRNQLKSHLIGQFTDADSAPQDVVAQTSFVLESILSTGEASLPVVARLLGRHPRMLQQALQAQGQTFRQVLDQVRYSEAQQQLRHSEQSITELALQLGYADETAFSRAFKRWSGKSPRAWRQAAESEMHP